MGSPHKVQTWKPVKTGIDALNLKVQARTKTGMLRLGAALAGDLTFKVDNTGGGAAGSAQIEVEIYEDPDDATPLHTWLLVDAISLLADREEVFVFGIGVTNFHDGNGTLQTIADALKVFNFVKFAIDVTTGSDATTCVGDLHLSVQE
jgi:hypothetical protein